MRILEPPAGVAQGGLDPGSLGVLGEVVAHPQADRGHGMVAEVLAHAGGVQHHGDAQIIQVSGRTNTGEHQYLGRGDGAATEDDAVGLDTEDFAAAFRFHPYRLEAVTVLLEEDAVDYHVAPDGEVQAVAVGVDVGKAGAHADAVGVVHGDGADAAGLRMVHVGVVGIAGGPGGIIEGLLEGQPLLAAKRRTGMGPSLPWKSSWMSVSVSSLRR